MALVAPFNLADAMITNVLSNVRRGVSLSRMQNTADSTLGVMVDLPDKIDFEINLLKNHQSITRNITTVDANNSFEGERVNISDFSINIGADSTLSLSSDLSNVTGTDSSRSGSGEIESTASNEQENSLSSELSGNRVNGVDLSRRNSVSDDGSNNIEITSEISGDISGVISGDRDGSNSGENAISNDGGTSGEKNDEKTVSIKNSKRVEGTKEDGKSNQQENSVERRTVNGTTNEAECSDRFMKSVTTRNYWKLDEDTGGVSQAS